LDLKVASFDDVFNISKSELLKNLSDVELSENDKKILSISFKDITNKQKYAIIGCFRKNFNFLKDSFLYEDKDIPEREKFKSLSL
jgi:hypothetical protein